MVQAELGAITGGDEGGGSRAAGGWPRGDDLSPAVGVPEVRRAGGGVPRLRWERAKQRGYGPVGTAGKLREGGAPSEEAALRGLPHTVPPDASLPGVLGALPQ